ncbi:MAG: ABC transporter ATP-binding protein [Rhodoferax sp.]|jgi:putative ABC transport system ATP-binding protein|uniref:ABC transporter ATP-binding protein n=1 Tax=Rhodoferax sp. TaxID=50421 RepID=UPI001B7BB476|nr:ABC transporter ATP-binding protein [Rhodoferax sp.]MBP9148968.1 ABC transporter ATP-binding protein [Rhodoferax sp.]MBP9735864.1 ABC transporter ATP-binding protein [Rhodoferax sp.]
MLELTQVTKLYHEGQPNQLAAVSEVDLCLQMGAVTVLEGPSGSGKTSLLTLIGCLARPTSGRVVLHGEALSGLPEQHLAQVRRKTFGFAFQRFNLIPGLSVLDNVMLPAYPLGLPYAQLVARAQDVMAQLNIGHRAAFKVELLSGGEMQRTAIARALINDPAIVIADEPTANLDAALTNQFLDIVASLKAGGKTIILSSHDPRITRSAVVDRVVTMADGRIVVAA